MIKALLLIFSENTLKIAAKSIKSINLSNQVLLAFILTSCSQVSKKTKEPNWNYPPDNPFPSVLELKKYNDQSVALIAKLKANTVKTTCSLRNDSPYFWCSFEGELMNPSPDLPKKVVTVFHVIVAEEGKQAALNFAKRLRKNNEPVSAVLTNRPFLMKKENTLSSQLYGVYNSKECFDLFEDYSLCPKSAKKLDIFSGKYLE